MKKPIKYMIFTAVATALVLTLSACIRQYDDTPYIPDWQSETAAEAAVETSETDSAAPETEALETTEPETGADEATAYETTLTDTSETEATTVSEPSIVDITDEKYSYSDMKSDLAELALKYPEIFSYKSIGQTHEGREIYAGTLGNPSAGKTVVITASTHAREYITTKVLMAQAEYILSNYSTASYDGAYFSELFGTVSIVIIPMLNPDGVMLAQDGVSSLTTDESRNAVNSIYSSVTTELSIDEFIAYNWKSNAMGVDLNRNAPCSDWETTEPGAIAPYFKNYKGASAGSEPETQAFVNFINFNPNVAFVAAYHTAGHVIYWNCGEMTVIGETAKSLAKITQSETETAGLKYANTGEKHFDSSITDWCMLSKKIPALTVEMCDANYPIADSQFESAYNQTLNLIPAYAKYFYNKNGG